MSLLTDAALLFPPLGRWPSWKRSDLNVDFGVGNELYKLFWSRNVRTDVASYHIPQTLIGNTATQLWRLKRIAMEYMAERRKRQAEPAKAA